MVAPPAAGAPVPAPRPADLARASRAQRPGPVAQAAGGGGLCGDPRLRGARIPEIEGPGACGIAQPVRLAGAGGLALEPPVSVGCEVAKAVADWAEGVVRPTARRRLGAEARALVTYAGYACRTRNNRPGGRLSEHAKGNAVDVAGVTLADGRTVMLAPGWRGAERPFWRDVWRGACGSFGTVLGPDSDRFHQNHLHLDVARHRSGPYCR